MKLALFLIVISSHVMAIEYDGLKPEEQKYFNNDIMQGKNKLERIDSNVREINRLHGEIATLKAEVAAMKVDIEALKKKK